MEKGNKVQDVEGVHEDLDEEQGPRTGKSTHPGPMAGTWGQEQFQSQVHVMTQGHKARGNEHGTQTQVAMWALIHKPKPVAARIPLSEQAFARVGVSMSCFMTLTVVLSSFCIMNKEHIHNNLTVLK